MTSSVLHTLPAFERRGAGEPLVLLHGLGSDHTFWYPVLDRLADVHDVVAVDLPGFGSSPSWPPDADWRPAGLAAGVRALLDALGFERVHIAGLSLGGWVGLELAADQSARSVTALAPAGLWLAGSSEARGTGELDLMRRLARLSGPVVPLASRIRPLARFALRRAVVSPSRVARSTLVAEARASARARGYRYARAGTRHGGFVRGEKIDTSVPVTVVFGDSDAILPAGDCQERDLLPRHTRWEVWPGCGHALPWEDPDGVVETVLATTASARDG